MQIQRRIFVSGKVQGVGFRASVHRKATDLGGLKGFVRNIKDGRVEAVFCGELVLVQKMVTWCQKGPPSAQVEGLEVIEELVDPQLADFSVQF